MTDWAVQSVIFMPENCPKMRRDYPKTTLKLLPNPPKNKNSK